MLPSTIIHLVHTHWMIETPVDAFYDTAAVVRNGAREALVSLAQNNIIEERRHFFQRNYPSWGSSKPLSEWEWVLCDARGVPYQIVLLEQLVKGQLPAYFDGWKELDLRIYHGSPRLSVCKTLEAEERVLRAFIGCFTGIFFNCFHVSLFLSKTRLLSRKGRKQTAQKSQKVIN